MVQNSKSKKAKPVEKAPPVSNGCNDSDESQAVKNAASKNVIENESAMNPIPKVESEINEQSNGDVPETSSNGARAATSSRKRKAAESAADSESTKSSENESTHPEEISTAPQSKTKGRPQKGKTDEMDAPTTATEEPSTSEAMEMKDSEEPTENPLTSRKRKASPEPEGESESVGDTESVETAEPPKKSGRRAAKSKTEQGSVETAEPAKNSRKRGAPAKGKAKAAVEELGEMNQEEESSETRKSSRKRKGPELVKPEAKSKKKEVKKAVPVTKSKKQKALLSVPPVTSVAGKVFVIGENDVGQLGFGEEIEQKTRPTLLELPYAITNIAAGGMHSVCLTESGEVITFGCNDEGSLGRVTTDSSEEASPGRVEIPEKIVQISAGDSHTAALSESGQVYLWGNFRSGDGPMGLTVDGAKQVKPIKILTKFKIVKISSGTEHLACLSNEGHVYTCGCGQNGQLGRLNERSCRDGGRRGLASFLEPDVVPVIGHPSSKTRPVLIADVWACSYSTFFKAQDTGLIYACGLNNYHQLGYTTEQVALFPKQVTSFNSRTWKELSGGQHHTLSLDQDALVYALGRKDYGRLGLGEDCEEVVSTQTLITTLEKEKTINISCGNVVSFAVTEDGSLYSWGFGTNNQLGHGNEDDCFVPRLVEGNFRKAWKSIKVSGGGQHTLVLAIAKESDNKK